MGRFKRPERTQSCQGNITVSQESDRSGSKAIRLAGGAVQKIAPFLPSKEQVASQEKVHQAKEQLDQKKKDWATGESELGKRGGAEKSPKGARSAGNPNLSCL